MAKKKKEKHPLLENIHTPRSRAIWPNLHVARKFNVTSKPAYDVALAFSGESAEFFVKRARDLLNLAAQKYDKFDLGDDGKPTPKVFHNPVQPLRDDDGNFVEGSVKVKFKVNAFGTDKQGTQFSRKPDFFDAEGNPIVDEALHAIGGGSEICLNVSPYIWDNPGGVGLTLQPVGVQIIDRVPFGRMKRSAESHGFGKVKGGFVVPESIPEQGESDEEAPEAPAGKPGTDF